MTCLNPMFAKRSAVPNANGKYELSNFVSYRDLSGKSLEIAKSELSNNYAVVVPIRSLFSFQSGRLESTKSG